MTEGVIPGVRLSQWRGLSVKLSSSFLCLVIILDVRSDDLVRNDRHLRGYQARNLQEHLSSAYERNDDMTTSQNGATASHLNPSSDLSQLLSSLGLSTASSTGSNALEEMMADQGPDPLIVARAKLTKLKTDLSHTAELLKQLNADVQSGDSLPVALRLSPPLTDAVHTESPYLVRLPVGQQDWRLVLKNNDAATYLPFAEAREALAALHALYTKNLNHFETLRTELVADAQQRIQQTMQAAASATPEGNNDMVMDEDGRALNEEGLPFVDPTEIVDDPSEGSKSLPVASGSTSTIEKFEPAQNLTGDDRKRWIEDVFRRYENEPEDQSESDDASGDSEGEREGRRQQKQPEQSSKAQNNPRRFVPQATLEDRRPPATPVQQSAKPLKSALKPSPSTASPLPRLEKFGSSGLRRGFLNMNPSSPAAIASSNPIDDPSAAADKMSSSWTSGQQQPTSSATIAQELKEASAVTQSLDSLPVRADAGATRKKKKSVRIQSPERERSAPPRNISASTAPHPDDVGVEDEAARIVELLGPQVVQGTERGDAALRTLQKEREAAEKEAARQVALQKDDELKRREAGPSKPAMGTMVVERPRGGAKAIEKSIAGSQINKTKQLAFKRGFLNKPPPSPAINTDFPAKRTETTPLSSSASEVGPSQSLGMSALDRSLINDENLSAERQSQGLSSAVPHARPSKAYQEKISKRQQGIEPTPPSTGQNGESSKVVGTGRKESEGGSKVKFQLVADPRDEETGVKSGSESGGDDGGEEHDDAAEQEFELDEHDEEAYARAAYASGDVDEVEGGEDDDGGHDSDWSLESYDYTPSDIADLEPTFNGLVSDLESAELAREYALAKAKQMQARQNMSEESRAELERAFTGERMKQAEREALDGNGDLWMEDELDGRDIAAAMDMDSGMSAAERKKRPTDPPNKMSRFKASRIVQALGMGVDSATTAREARPPAGWVSGATEADMRADQAGHDLAHLLEHAQNVGPDLEEPSPGVQSSASGQRPSTSKNRAPVMVLPSLTPLRYPRKQEALTEDTPLPKEGVDLEGETDEDEEDEVLMDVMRARLAEREEREQRQNEKTEEGPIKPRQPVKKMPGRGWNAETGDHTSSGSRSQASTKNLSAPPSLAPVRKHETATNTWTEVSPPKKNEFDRDGSEATPPPKGQPTDATAAPASGAPKMSRFKAARLAAQQAKEQ